MPQLLSQTSCSTSAAERTMQGSFIIGKVPLRNPITISTWPSFSRRRAISLIFSVYSIMRISSYLSVLFDKARIGTQGLDRFGDLR